MNEKERETHTRVSDIAAALRARIRTGKLAPGEQMPSVRELARANGVSAFTAARVYDLLVAEGLVDARRGTGYFVAKSANQAQDVAPRPEPLADSIAALRMDYDSRLIRVDAGCGWLPPDWLFSEGVRTALTQIARRPSAYAGRYGSVYGLRPLRRHICTRLAHQSIDCNEEQVVLTHGASQALELSISVLTKPGDCVLVDDPCYPYVLEMLRARGVRPIGVPRTAEGPDLNALNAVAAATHPRAFITNTTLQNPTGTTTSAQVAHEILLAARRHDFTIVEDDIFAELAPVQIPNLASLSGLKNVIYIGSFSKTIAPNLRVGYIAASVEHAQAIARLKNVLSLSTSELTEQIVLSILTGGRHRTHLERLKQRLAQAHQNVSRRFAELGVDIAFRSSGIFLWAKLPTELDSSAVLSIAKTRGIMLAPGEIFRPDEHFSGHYRFNVAYSDDEALYEFIDSLRASSKTSAR
jgi:DNA-binding transcriptional MocR family regulator